jgi:hypothetical protein
MFDESTTEYQAGVEVDICPGLSSDCQDIAIELTSTFFLIPNHRIVAFPRPVVHVPSPACKTAQVRFPRFHRDTNFVIA